MDDQITSGFWGELGREFVSIARRLIDARSVHRKRIYNEAVVPNVARLEASHEDFIKIFSGARWILQDLDAALRSNDTQAKIQELKNKINDLSVVRDQRRSERRSMYEEVRWRLDKIETGTFKLGEFVLSGEEVEIMTAFYKHVLSYFETEEGQYNHRIHEVLGDALELVADAREGALDRSEIVAQVAKLDAIEADKEEHWAAVSRASSLLKDAIN